MSFLWKYWRKYKFMFLLSVLCVVFEAACDLMQPQIMAKLIDNGVSKLDLQYVLAAGLLMLGVTALGALFACTRNVLSSKTSQSFGADLRRDLFEKIIALPISESDSFDGGSLVTRLTNDVTQLTNFINGLMRIIFKAPIVAAGCIILAIRINVHTAPIVAGIVLIAALSLALSMKLSYPVFAKVQKNIDQLNTAIREYLMGIRLVKAFGRTDFEEERFNGANERLRGTTATANRIVAFFGPITNIAANLGVVLVLIMGYSLVKQDKMQVGQVMAFIAYMTQILTSFSMISNILNMFMRTKASYIRIAEVMDIDAHEDCGGAVESAEELRFDGETVSFRNVDFKYPLSTGDAAIQGLSFDIRRGETLGIIGPTGSGKSTVAALILGFYKHTGGDIRIGGKSAGDIPAALLRRHIRYVPQTPLLFTGTVKENILWGKSDATDEEIERAAKTSEAYDFIASSKNGFETVLGQGGVNLSGGQKQRVSIARALVANPDLLILDDCTSALDAITEYKVQKGLKAYSPDLACILIAQRISTVMKADRILVLDGGRQAGLGTHKELITGCPVYRDIYNSQIGSLE